MDVQVLYGGTAVPWVRPGVAMVVVIFLILAGKVQSRSWRNGDGFWDDLPYSAVRP
jgi:hypothetical protein